MYDRILYFGRTKRGQITYKKTDLLVWTEPIGKLLHTFQSIRKLNDFPPAMQKTDVTLLN